MQLAGGDSLSVAETGRWEENAQRSARVNVAAGSSHLFVGLECKKAKICTVVISIVFLLPSFCICLDIKACLFFHLPFLARLPALLAPVSAGGVHLAEVFLVCLVLKCSSSHVIPPAGAAGRQAGFILCSCITSTPAWNRLAAPSSDPQWFVQTWLGNSVMLKTSESSTSMTHGLCPPLGSVTAGLSFSCPSGIWVMFVALCHCLIAHLFTCSREQVLAYPGKVTLWKPASLLFWIEILYHCFQCDCREILQCTHVISLCWCSLLTPVHCTYQGY